MPSASAERFSCDSCNRVYAWKEELAGKRVKCKCGNAIAVPKTIASPDGIGLDDDGLYALVADAEAAAKRQPVVIRQAEPAVETAAARPSRTQLAAPAAGGSGMSVAATTLGYRRGPTARERQQASLDNTLDMNRDLYAPLVMLAIGMALQVGFYSLHYNLGIIGISVIGFGLGIMTLVKAVGLILFALVIAGPLGVSFGGPWTAALKLAATAWLCDGITTIINMTLSKMGAGYAAGGMFTYGIIAWPVAIFTYWAAFTYLFSMDASDAKYVVIILAIIDRIVRWILMLVMLSFVMGMVHVALPRAGGAGFTTPASHSSASPDPLADKMARLAGTNWLIEGHDYVKNELFMTAVVNNLYAHGCKHVWFEVVRDINQRATSAGDVIAELPDDPQQRAQCYADVKAFYDSNKQIDYDPADLVDKGNPYMEIDMQ